MCTSCSLALSADRSACSPSLSAASLLPVCRTRVTRSFACFLSRSCLPDPPPLLSLPPSFFPLSPAAILILFLASRMSRSKAVSLSLSLFLHRNDVAASRLLLPASTASSSLLPFAQSLAHPSANMTARLHAMAPALPSAPLLLLLLLQLPLLPSTSAGKQGSIPSHTHRHSKPRECQSERSTERVMQRGGKRA